MKETAGLQPAAPLNLDAASDVDDAIALWLDGVSVVKIAAALRVSAHAIRRRLRDAGLDTSRPATWVGLLSLSEAERTFSIDRHSLVDAAAAGRVRTRGTSNFYGPTTWLFHPLELAEDLRRLRCRHDGCDAIALGASGACEPHGHLYLGNRATGVARPDIGPKIAAAKTGVPRPDAEDRLKASWKTGGAFARAAIELEWITGATRRLWKLRWAPRPGRPRKWTDAQAAEVIAYRDRGFSVRHIEDRTGVSKSTVARILEAQQGA